MFKRETYLILRVMSYISSIFPFSIFAFLEYRNSYYEFWGNKFITPSNCVWILMITQIFSIIYIVYFYKIKIVKSSRYNKNLAKFKQIKQEKANTSNYVLANVLPVITINMNDENMAIFVVILLILLGFMYIKNDLYHINPLYDLIGVKVYDCVVEVYDFQQSYEKTLNYSVISSINIYDFDSKYYEINITPNEIIFVNKPFN